MKFLMCFIVSGMLIIISCKKESGSRYYFRADVNSTGETFNDDDYAQEYFGDISAGFSVNGKNKSAHHQLTLSIGHTFTQSVTEGTYDKNSVSEHYVPGIAYTINDTLNYGSAVKPENPYPVSITISNLTENTVTGTFHGIVYNPDNPADSFIISNGEFYVPLRH